MRNADTPSVSSSADVLIVGAGPAGLALAAALADIGLQVQVLEQQPLAALQAPADDGREIALTHRSRSVMERLGLWAALPPEVIAPLREARVLDGDVDGQAAAALRFAAPDGSGDLGWLVPNHRIRAAAWAAAISRPGVRVLTDARVTALELHARLSDDAPADSVARITLADGRTLSAPLVVAADSRFSTTRRLAGIGAQMHDFARSVIVAPLTHSAPHQGIAWECFRYDNTLALLPMAGLHNSAVVTLPADRTAEWLALPDEAFAGRIQQQSGGRLGEITGAGPRHHYPLVGVYAHRFAATRFALIGDAAVGMHPVTAHGYNFGLYGVELLARELAAARQRGGDAGDAVALANFEREHRRHTLPIYLGTNAVVGLFTDGRRGARLARRVVLAAADKLPGVSALVKGAITAQLTGRPSRPRPAVGSGPLRWPSPR